MKKTTVTLCVLVALCYNGFSQFGNIKINKPKLNVSIPEPPPIEIGKKKDKNISTSTTTTASKGSENNSASTASKSSGSTREQQFAKEEEYMIGLGKFIAPYQDFVTQFDWGNVSDPEVFEFFKKMDYDLFKSKDNEFNAYKPLDAVEFNQNDNKYKPRNSFHAVERFYERQYAAMKNGGTSTDRDYPSIKDLLMSHLEGSYKTYKELKAEADSKYYNVDTKITSIEAAIAPLDFWTTTEFLENDAVVKADLENFKKELAELKQIKATGADKAYVDKKEKEYHAEALAKVKMSKPAMSNPAYEEKARKKVQELEKCVVKRVVITESSWYISKNDFGIPLDKYLPTEVEYTKDGKCYLLYGSMVEDYMGGGTYEATPYFSYNEGGIYEMDCNNMK